MNQPPIQFPLCPDSLIKNSYRNSSYSHVGNGGNEIEVGMDELLRDMGSMELVLLYAFQDNDLGDDTHIIESFFESLKSVSNTPLFGPGQSKST